MPLSNKNDPAPAQLRAARGLLGWSQTDLARAAGVSPRTIKMLEAAASLAPLAARPRTVEALVEAFLQAGVTLTRRHGRIGAERDLPDELATSPRKTGTSRGKAAPEGLRPHRPGRD